MSESVKFQNNTYLDTTGIVHNKKILSGILDNMTSKILWRNPNPTSDMGENTTINLSSDNYDIIEWFFIYSNGTANLNMQSSTSCMKGNSVLLTSIGYNTGNTIRRILDFSSPTEYISRIGKNGTSDSGAYAIPIIAIGYKLQLEEDMKNILPTDVNSWEVGTITTGTGLPSNNNARLRTKNFITIKSSEDYSCSIENTDYKFVNIHFYNADKNWITSQENISSINNSQNKEITTPENAAYIKVVVRRTDGSTMTVNEIENIKPIIVKK